MSKNLLPEYSNQDEKRKFFSLEIIDTEDQFKDLFEKVLPSKFKEGGVWRGVSESQYKLFNSLQREDVKYKKLSSDDDVIIAIKNSANHLDNWRSNIISKYFKNYGIEDVPIFAKLSILRHYGVPSPLIDWTRDPRVALFFATQKHNNVDKEGIDNYFSIYFMTPNHPYYKLDFKLGYREVLENDEDFKNEVAKRVNIVVKHGGDHFLQQELRERVENEYLQIALNDLELTLGNIKKQNIQRIEDYPNDKIRHFIRNNLNITAQNGLFIINTDPIRPLEEAILFRINNLAMQVGYPTIDINKATKINKENFFCFDIHKKFINRIIFELKKQNFTKKTMEPNLKKLKDEITFEKITEGISR